MTSRFSLPVGLICLSALTACSDAPPTTARNVGANDPTAMTINGTAIPLSVYERLALSMLQKPLSEMSEEERIAVREQLIIMYLVSGSAQSRGLDQEPQIAAELEVERMELLMSAMLDRYLELNPPRESEIRDMYELEIQALTGTEYKARHILVEEEDEALSLIEQLDDGADFASLAREHSTGPTGPDGGDLGWFLPSRMVAPFADAVERLSPGSYSSNPVQTRFGWHVILVEDTRQQEPPGVDAMRPELENLAQEAKLKSYIDSLRASATIEFDD